VIDKNNFTCDFCFTKREDLTNPHCAICGNPVNGTKDEKERFAAANEKLKQKIDEAETALSQARFAMLWPSLTAVILTFAFNFPPHNFYQFAGTLIFYAIFIGAYFIVAWQPFPILVLTSMLLLAGVLFTMWKGTALNPLLLVPGIILLIYLNAVYSVWRADKALEIKHHETK
jgi:hypothetical protein